MKPHEYVIMEIARERERQMAGEGWSAEHDDKHSRGEMARGAACYALNATDWADQFLEHNILMRVWPWSVDWWKPKDRRRDLVRAAALIVAEIERLDRQNARWDHENGRGVNT